MRIAFWWIDLYTLWALLGVLGGSVWLVARAPHFSMSRAALPGLLWAVAVGALLAGRIGYVAGHGEYFAVHLGQILAPWRAGGLYGGSAWLGGLLAVLLYARWQHRPLCELLSLLAPAALLVAAGAWRGCAAAGCAWGKEALLAPRWAGWLVVDAPDLYHTLAPRYAVQALGVGWALATAALAATLRRCGGLAVALYLVGEAALTAWRADPMPVVGPFRVDWLLDVGLAALLWIVQWRYRQINARTR